MQVCSFVPIWLPRSVYIYSPCSALLRHAIEIKTKITISRSILYKLEISIAFNSQLHFWKFHHKTQTKHWFLNQLNNYDFRKYRSSITLLSHINRPQIFLAKDQPKCGTTYFVSNKAKWIAALLMISKIPFKHQILTYINISYGRQKTPKFQASK